MGKWTSFPRSGEPKPNETVVFAYIVYRSRAHRDAVNAKAMTAMTDPRLAKMNAKTMPFDGRRMVFGGIKLLVGA
jgi:uncharacterized protein YbaA (DUF1428 family)